MTCSHVITMCKYVHVDYKQFINDVYKLNYVSNVYNRSFGQMKHASYWPKYEGPTMCHDPQIWKRKNDHPRSTRIHTKMDQREREQPKCCSLCKTVGHSKNKCPNTRGSTSQSRQCTH